jgi:hypothetical protein
MIAAFDVYFDGGFAWALVIVGFGLAAAVLIYFLIMSAIANRVNRPHEKPGSQNDRRGA